MKSTKWELVLSVFLFFFFPVLFGDGWSIYEQFREYSKGITNFSPIYAYPLHIIFSIAISHILFSVLKIDWRDFLRSDLNKFVMFLIIIAFVLAFLSSDYAKDSRCRWHEGPCESALGFNPPKYYYDSKTGECKPRSSSSCTAPPFDTMDECVKTCK